MTYATQDYRDRQDYSQALSGDTIVAAVWSIVPSATLDGQVDSSTETRIFVSGLQADTQYILTVRVTGASGEIYDNDATINEQAPPVPVVPVAPAAPTPTTRQARVNASQLRAFGGPVLIANSGGGILQFTALRLGRQPLENESSGAFERVWTTTAALATAPAVGATVQLGTVEYVVHNTKPDEDPDSNGFTIHLQRKKPL